MMKSITLSTTVTLAIMGISLPAQALEADLVKKLQDTRSCAGCNLSNANLSGLDLRQANLQGANLSNANLSNANLSQANLSHASLQGATLYLTNFQQANLVSANLSQANLTGAQLEKANLQRTNLGKATLNSAKLTAANLSHADLSHANLREADLSHTTLVSANFQGATLQQTNFQGTARPQTLAAPVSVSSPSDPALATSSPPTQHSLNSLTHTNRQDYLTASSIDFKTNPPDPTARPDSSAIASTQPSDFPTIAEPPLSSSPAQTLSEPLLVQESTSPRSTSVRAADLVQVESAAPASLAQSETTPQKTDSATKEPIITPLANQQFQQPTAIHLPKGVVSLNLYNRLFFLPGPEADSGTAAYPNIGVTWGVTDSTELDLTLQVVDTGSPDRLGPFSVRRVSNRDLTLSVKQRLWNNAEDTLAFSGVFSVAAPLTKRTFEFNPGVIERENKSLIPALQLPFTATVGDRWQFTLSPTVAFFPDSNAVFIPRPPLANSGSFGTTLGLSGAISFQVHPRLTLWGDAFVPFTGNNSFDRDTGLPAKAIAYNAGLRYFINPSLGIDLFATNTFGGKGSLALTADKDLTGVGVRVIALPSLFSANRRYADSFNRQREGQDSPLTTDGLAFLDGGTVPSQRFLWNLQAGGQGIMTALRYGITKDFELSTYLDYIFGEVDESEQGFGVKLRLLNQDEGAPLTGSAAITVGLTNNLFDNFDNNSRNGRFRLGDPKDFPLIFATDSPEGRRFVVTVSLPLHYKANDQLAFWFTPMLGFVQRDGVELGGFNVGGSVEVIHDLSLVGELGANFFGEGNAFIGNTLADRIPWSFAVRWDPSRLFGSESRKGNRPHVEVYVTNRVGASTWNQLRVRDQNEVTVGAGIAIPF
ncbi:MAG: hypothetical protein HC851_11855 [Acaryochloris sp. RU_4_1]|nr:hypothetical protein [Acaryochloris sp. RU_4_1]